MGKWKWYKKAHHCVICKIRFAPFNKFQKCCSVAVCRRKYWIQREYMKILEVILSINREERRKERYQNTLFGLENRVSDAYAAIIEMTDIKNCAYCKHEKTLHSKRLGCAFRKKAYDLPCRCDKIYWTTRLSQDRAV